MPEPAKPFKVIFLDRLVDSFLDKDEAIRFAQQYAKERADHFDVSMYVDSMWPLQRKSDHCVWCCNVISIGTVRVVTRPV